jgi:phenylacetate-CoA ligase
MTSIAEERAEQRRWHFGPRLGPMPEFAGLLRNEFAPPEAHRAWLEKALRSLFRHANENVPYYRELFARIGASPEDLATPGALAALPFLTKRGLYEREADLTAKSLPEGEIITGFSRSSGTTGRPTKVHMNSSCARMFTILKQREFRWFRFDPLGKFAAIRLPSQLPAKPDGSFLGNGEVFRAPGWHYMGVVFKTGPFAAFSVINPVERQIAWLRQEKPDYLMTYSETLEHLALAAGSEPPAPSLRGVLAISEQLTPAMRRRIESRFRVPIRQNYGLNEVGLVAARCEEGRYHVHIEHCLVEIVDDSGSPVPPGRTGRIVVTSLRNYAMPLIRYDTDDMAVALAGLCPCGRTLPGFGEIAGRYSRIAYLPEGTLGRVGAVRGALETMPAEYAANLRKFQVHQYQDGRFELRLAVAAPLPAGFSDHVQAAWSAGAEAPLAIVEVADIPRGPGGKFQDFTSDFVPAPDTGREGDEDPPDTA